MCFFKLVEIMEKVFKEKNYQHIDKKIKIDDVINKVKNPNFVSKHAFYPFLSYTITMHKYVKRDKNTYERKEKSRPIKYASHIDRYIYQWYSHLLNDEYNSCAVEKDISNSVIAYRTCLKGKTNIEFSRKAFDYIKKTNSCYILVSDLSNFFDKIDHKKLKNNLSIVLNQNSLPDDYYKIYKSMTKYSYIEKADIIAYLLDNNIESEKSLKKCNSLLDKIEWKIVKKKLKNKIIKNDKNYGIPQGSPLSGIFANIYMIDFDKYIKNYVDNKHGLYMRYSDDIIIIIPSNEIESISEIWNIIQNISKEYNTMELNIEKTSGYLYDGESIKSLHEDIYNMRNGNNFVSYLGFSFDGKNIKFRDKTLTKFYYKLYRKIDEMIARENLRIEKGKKKHTKIDKHQIIKNAINKNNKTRKFIDYVDRAIKVYPNEKYIVEFRNNVKSKIFDRFNK